MLKIRFVYSCLLAFAVFLLAISFILQFGFQLEPCPLCIIDRIIVLILTVFYSIALWHNPSSRQANFYCAVGFIIAVLGIIVAARHLWIIHLPPNQVPSCGPGFNYLMSTLPPKEALMVILKGSGECAEATGTIAGLTLPGWAMLSFIILAFGCLLPLFYRQKKG